MSIRNKEVVKGQEKLKIEKLQKTHEPQGIIIAGMFAIGMMYIHTSAGKRVGRYYILMTGAEPLPIFAVVLKSTSIRTAISIQSCKRINFSQNSYKSSFLSICSFVINYAHDG